MLETMVVRRRSRATAFSLSCTARGSSRDMLMRSGDLHSTHEQLAERLAASEARLAGAGSERSA
jgi:hypothetical protein